VAALSPKILSLSFDAWYFFSVKSPSCDLVDGLGVVPAGLRLERRGLVHHPGEDVHPLPPLILAVEGVEGDPRLMPAEN
jgi:hypothetical protein